MENSLAVLLAFLHIAALAFISKIIFKRHPRRKHPPGPKPWPIIGNFNLIGSLPHQSLHVLSQKYGDIMLLKFGKFPVVIASSPNMAKQFLRVHDTNFASRPALAAGKYTAYNYSDVIFASYGPHWRQARRIYHLEVFNEKRLKSFEHIRVEERRIFLSRLCSQSGKPVRLRDHLSRYTLSSISRMAFGNKYFSESNHDKAIVSMDELQEMLDEWFLLNAALNIGDWIPWLSFLDLQGYVKKMKSLHRKFDRFNDYVIDDHQATRAAEDDFFPKDVVDMLLLQAEDPNLEVELTRDCIKGLLLDVLVAGTDTSATAVEWAVHEILKHPRVTEKAKEELDRVIGRNRWAEENDFSQLPYIDAIIMESLRLHPPGTLLVPHYATDDCKVAGYDISKGTIVSINAWSIGRDPNSWEAPESFLPERFMGKETDMLGSNYALLPFGSGRRRCPGYSLGLKVVRSTLANLLHGFNLKLVEGVKPEDISMEEMYGLTIRPKEPLSIIMEPTLPDYLY
uniref:Cytochrome P450 92B64 n=1 Tax=Callicarpa americana TaxID=204211 RepID=A0A9Y1LN11_CALAM|nr:cytochrome P450 92B64 [Callicarpa americana]